MRAWYFASGGIRGAAGGSRKERPGGDLMVRRLAFCVLNVESRIDDLLEFVRGVFSNSRAPECA